jgi:hypothetical protein
MLASIPCLRGDRPFETAARDASGLLSMMVLFGAMARRGRAGARFRLAPEKLAREPHAGGLLALDVGARGLPEPLYQG